MTITDTYRYRGYEIEPVRELSQWRARVHPTRADLPMLRRSTLHTLRPYKEDALAAAKKRIDETLSKLH